MFAAEVHPGITLRTVRAGPAITLALVGEMSVGET